MIWSLILDHSLKNDLWSWSLIFDTTDLDLLSRSFHKWSCPSLFLTRWVDIRSHGSFFNFLLHFPITRVCTWLIRLSDCLRWAGERALGTDNTHVVVLNKEHGQVRSGRIFLPSPPRPPLFRLFRLACRPFRLAYPSPSSPPLREKCERRGRRRFEEESDFLWLWRGTNHPNEVWSA